MGTDGHAAGLVLAGLLLGATAPSAQAQPGKTRGQIEEAGIEIVKIRINDLPEATRNFDKVALPELPKADRKVTYTYPDFRLPADRLNPSVRVLSVRAEEPEPLMGNYIKAGLGNFATFYGRAYLHSTRREDYSYGLDLKHINSLQGPVNGGNSGLSQSSASLNGELYKGTAALGATLDYGRERYNFYGYGPTARLPENDEIKQVFNRLGIKAYARNRDPENIIQYEAGLGFRRWSDDYEASENNVLVNGKVGYALGETSRITLAADASFITDQDSANGSRSRTFAQATPAYELTGKRVSLMLGITAGYSSDTLNGVSKTAIYPAVRAGYTVLPEKFMVYAGLGGALQRVTRYDLSTENYWINPTNLNVADTHRAPTIYGGFTSSPFRGLELNARATYSRDKNLYFYLNNPQDPARFDLVYDKETTGLLNVHGELLYNQAEKFRLGARVDYNQYSMKTLAKPFHRPEFQSSIFGTYNVYDKLLIGVEAYFIAASYGISYLAGTDIPDFYRATDAITDLNLRADYRITPKISIFAMGNNLLGREYQRFYRYPVKGANVIGGASYAF